MSAWGRKRSSFDQPAGKSRHDGDLTWNTALSKDERQLLMMRVMHFCETVQRAGDDLRFSEYLQASKEGFAVSDEFMEAITTIPPNRRRSNLNRSKQSCGVYRQQDRNVIPNNLFKTTPLYGAV